ncbi:Gastrula zinc finger protein XlCGF8.2DB [Armadillidium nasatum]|uniref:Gastrula zinc finger protein XlCGF8.2DB n=1 Tax=Armadillidium nasatum TaxID=96803 RepID=A0A5N5T4B6_9CRUS|nr:Gastrula zinc finger protein XlCGF8.2DB [Armadillidium nasatum]
MSSFYKQVITLKFYAFLFIFSIPDNFTPQICESHQEHTNWNIDRSLDAREEQIGNSFSINSASQSLNTNFPVRCRHCSFRSPNWKELHFHWLSKHSKDKPYSCSLCQFSCKFKQNLVIHMRIHSGEKPFKCPHCGTVFRHSNSLRRHLKNKIQCNKEILKQNRYSCSMCPLKFYIKNDLRRHIRVHTGEKPYSCPRCFRKFNRKFTLRSHLAKKNACTPHVSSRDYISNSAKNNVKAKRFACTMCDFRFHLRSDLERHILVHTGEKPFSCPRCSRKFRQESHLRKHLAKKILCIP